MTSSFKKAVQNEKQFFAAYNYTVINLLISNVMLIRRCDRNKM